MPGTTIDEGKTTNFVESDRQHFKMTNSTFCNDRNT